MKISGPETNHKILNNSCKFWVFYKNMKFDFLRITPKLTLVNFELKLMTVCDVLSQNETKLNYINKLCNDMMEIGLQIQIS